jgi:hypothetical protein
MTFPSEERMAGGAEVAGAEPGRRDAAAGQAAMSRAGDGTTAADAAADGRWSKIQAMFVDDPRAAVAEAASLVDGAIEAHIATVREQQASLASPWQAQDAGTEQLRVALREYRTFWNSVTGLWQPA